MNECPVFSDFAADYAECHGSDEDFYLVGEVFYHVIVVIYLVGAVPYCPAKIIMRIVRPPVLRPSNMPLPLFFAADFTDETRTLQYEITKQPVLLR